MIAPFIGRFKTVVSKPTTAIKISNGISDARNALPKLPNTITNACRTIFQAIKPSLSNQTPIGCTAAVVASTPDPCVVLQNPLPRAQPEICEKACCHVCP